jgi:hypothetical protein
MANVVVSSKLIHGTVFELNGKEIVVNGQNSGELVVVHGYQGACGMTSMPEETWQAIEKKYAGMTAIQEGYIFAQKNEANAKSEAAEKKDLKTGGEQHVLKKGEKEE